MISKGDLVKMRLSIGSDSGGKSLREMFVFGRVMNYCDDEETYIIEPKVISVPKEQVAEIETLLKDFDFEEVSMELTVSQKNRKRERPPEITDIRFSRER